MLTFTHLSLSPFHARALWLLNRLCFINWLNVHMWLYLPVTSKRIWGDCEIYLHLFRVQGLLEYIKLWIYFHCESIKSYTFMVVPLYWQVEGLSQSHYVFVLTEWELSNKTEERHWWYSRKVLRKKHCSFYVFSWEQLRTINRKPHLNHEYLKLRNNLFTYLNLCSTW